MTAPPPIKAHTACPGRLREHGEPRPFRTAPWPFCTGGRPLSGGGAWCGAPANCREGGWRAGPAERRAQDVKGRSRSAGGSGRAGGVSAGLGEQAPQTGRQRAKAGGGQRLPRGPPPVTQPLLWTTLTPPQLAPKPRPKRRSEQPQSPSKAGRSAKLGLSNARVHPCLGPHLGRLGGRGQAWRMASPTLHTKRQAAREAGTGVRSIGFHMGFTRGEAKEGLASGGSLGLMGTRRSWMQWRTPPTKATVSGQTPQPGPLAHWSPLKRTGPCPRPALVPTPGRGLT